MNWAHYILQVNIYLTLFYCFYRLLLARETYFLFNRVYLVFSGFLSLAIPFLRIEWFTRQQAAQQIYAGVGQISSFVENVGFNSAPSQQINWGKLIVLIYLAGVILFLVKFFFQLAILKKLLNGITTGQAFSFFNRKIVDPALPEKDVINHHEDIHIRQLHTIDLIFFELLTIFIWFNPIIYFYKQTIKSIHEYLADERAASYQGNKEEYALLLLSKAFRVDPNMLTSNFFNQSLIKRRIFMLHKQRSKKTAVLKYGLFVPLFALTLLLSSATIRENENIREVADDLPIVETILSPERVITLPEVEVTTVKRAHRLLALPDVETLRKYLAGRVRYPGAAIEKKLQGNSLIKFTIAKGIVKDIGAEKSLGEGCDAEAMKAILSYTSFKDIPDGKYTITFQFRLADTDTEILNNTSENLEGYQKLGDIAVVGNTISGSGTQVVVKGVQLSNITAVKGDVTGALVVVNGKEVPHSVLGTIVPSNIENIQVLNGVNATAIYGEKAKEGALILSLKERDEIDNVYDYVSVTKQPTYPGGIDKFRAYVSSTLKYPAEALKEKKQGSVNVSFIVEKDGGLSDIKVERELGYGMDEEAIRVIKESKKWIPAIKDGSPVRVKYFFPIKFVLNAEKTKN